MTSVCLSNSDFRQFVGESAILGFRGRLSSGDSPAAAKARLLADFAAAA
jgi:hypothetical protein